MGKLLHIQGSLALLKEPVKGQSAETIEYTPKQVSWIWH